MIGAKIKLPYPHAGQQAVRSAARRFNCLSAGRRWRKTTLAMSISVEAALKKGTYIWGAPTFDQVRIGFNEVRRAAGQVAIFNRSRMTATFPTGGEIVFKSLDNPDNARGYTADGVIVDEAGFVKGEAWDEVLRPMLMDTNGWAWLIGTPKGHNWFWREFSKAGANDDYMSWQIPTKGCKIQDGELIPDPHPLENPDIPFSEIVNLYRTLPERVFLQEVQARFIDDAGGVFRRVMECATGNLLDAPLENHQYIAGVDVADKADFTVVTVIDVRTKEMIFMDRFNRVGYVALQDRLHATYKRFKLKNMIVEDNSIGMPVIDNLRQRGMVITPFHTSRATKQPLIQNLQSAFEHGDITILNDPVLIGELQAYESKKTASGFSYSAPSGLHDDCVMSLAIAWQGVSSMPATYQDLAGIGKIEDYESRWA